ncbi:MAG: hypothetical protein JSV92_01425 [archaeon]|nr:MAG: hypothetical protein JSV92_01425 [archaeon]
MSDGSDKKENVITYETFRKFQRLERDNDNLQKLPGDFFQSCAEWIDRKGRMYQENKDPMVLKEIENVMSIIRDILDRRERKLLLMAMHAVRSDAAPQNLHLHEEKHFDSIVDHLKDMRVKILNIIKGSDEVGKTQEKEETTEELEKEFKKEIRKAAKKSAAKKPELPKQETLPRSRHEKLIQEEPEPQPEAKEEPDKKPDIEKEEKPEEAGEQVLPKMVEPEGYKLIKILEEVPKFLGTDEKTYGPFKKDDMVTVEEKIAELLVNKGKAELANK